MADAQTATQAPKVTRREDYREPDWRVPEIAMDFDLDPAATRVRTTLRVERNGTHDRPLRLDGDGLTALGVRVDGAQVSDWSMDGASLVVPLTGAAHEIETEVEIAPERNTQLQGLYASGGILCTQCEAEGFRRITFFPDRPDVLSKYKVKLTADKVRFPVLLANGDPIAQGDLEGGRHWAEWHDPFPKPSYLFALVAGDLVANRGTFITMSGRTGCASGPASSGNCAARSTRTSSMRLTGALPISAEKLWSRKTVKPSFSESWNQSRQVTRSPDQLWKYSCATTPAMASKSASVALSWSART